MRALLVRLILLVATLFVLATSWGRAAWAEGEPAPDAAEAPDVGVVVQPAVARLPAPPADFQHIDGGWIVLDFPASVADRVAPLVGEASDFRARVGAELGQPVLEHAIVRVARDPETMAALGPEGAPPPAYASGYALPAMHVIVLSLKAPGSWEATDLPELLRHELMHLALNDAVAGHHVPRWFNEGLAILESGELAWARRETLWQATISKSLLSFSELDRGFRADSGQVNVAYAESADVVRFLMRDDDRARFGSLVQRLRGGADFDRAVEDAYGTDMRKVEYEWREDVSHRFGILPLLTGGGAIWTFITGLAAAAWVKRRRRAKAKLEQWAREEAEADVAALEARERMALENANPGDEDDLPAHARPGIPVVEHEGRWHTLH
jgi:hypothetical protein